MSRAIAVGVASNVSSGQFPSIPILPPKPPTSHDENFPQHFLLKIKVGEHDFLLSLKFIIEMVMGIINKTEMIMMIIERDVC